MDSLWEIWGGFVSMKEQGRTVAVEKILLQIGNTGTDHKDVPEAIQEKKVEWSPSWNSLAQRQIHKNFGVSRNTHKEVVVDQIAETINDPSG